MRRCWVGLVCVALSVLLAVVLPAVAGARGSAALATGSHLLRPLTHTHPLLGSDSQSLNWSGDDVTGGLFTSVTATWTQPRVRSGGSRFTDAAFWVGLDGDGSGTVEQIGTEGYSEGVVGYDAWYEMYPAYPVTIGMTIHAGDVLTGSVTWSSPATFTLSLVNHTSGASFTTTQPMSVPPALASAEIIAEAPSSSSGVVPLADFTRCDFSACAIDGQPLGSYDWTRIDMVNENGKPVDATLPLGADGASFSVTTDVTAPTTTVRGARATWSRAPVTLHFAATDGIGTGVASTEYSLDQGATWTEGGSVTIAAPADHSGDGVHDVLYRSTDNVGNVEKDRVCRVRIDTQRPTPLATPAHVRRGRVATLHFAVGDPRPGSPTAKVTVLVTHGRRVVKRAVLLRRAVDTPLVYRFRCRLPRGSYHCSIKASDAAGNRQTAPARVVLVVH